MTLWFKPSSQRRARREAPHDARGWVPVVDPRDVQVAPVTMHGVRLYTADRVVVGTVRGNGRLSDILNQRGTVLVQDASVRRPGQAPGAAGCVQELALDAFEIDVAMANRLPDAAWTRARRVHKLPYPVGIDAGDYAVEGLVHVFPGGDPLACAKGVGPLFVPVTEARVRHAGRVISDPTVDAVLLNRHLIRGIDLRDLRGAAPDTIALLERRALAPA